MHVPLAVWLGLAFLLATGGGVAWGTWQNICLDCPSVAQIYTYEPRVTSKIYARDSRIVAELGPERRTLVAIDDLPPHVPQAFIAIEDRRFYQHDGLDFPGIARAVFGVIRTRSLSGGGGSTITQQLARNLWTESIGFEKRVVRKLKEWKVALALESAYEKDEILEAYMNQIGYAHGWYGLQTASRRYFGKDAVEMNPAESALLAAIANRPELYTPLRNPDAAKGRRDLVLDRMVREGFLTREEADRWQEEPVPTEAAGTVQTQAPYFVEWVRGILDERFGNQIYSAGFKVYTTLDLEMQEYATASMELGWDRIESWPGYEHPKYDEFTAENDGDDLPNIPYVQGMFVAMDPETGHVRAMIGGRDFKHSKFNRATQANRQAGSSFKPFVYLAALESDIPASEIVTDAPVVLDQVDGTTWRPSNYDPEFLGPITIREGLRRSINMIAIQLAQNIGLEAVAQTATKMGIATEIERYPSTAIGASEVIPIQMLEAYSTLSTLGMRVTPYPIIRVESSDGEVLWEPRPERRRVLEAPVARIGVSLLEDVVAAGTGHNGIRVTAGLPRELPAAGKTGTTNEGSNVWFMGFTPNLVAGVWFGMDLPVSIVERATGGGFAAPVWGDFMRRVYYGGSQIDDEADDGERPGPAMEIPETWPIPAELVVRLVDSKTGHLASRWCPAQDAYEELYLPRTEPTTPCDRNR